MMFIKTLVAIIIFVHGVAFIECAKLNGLNCTAQGYHADTNDCTKFYRCVDGPVPNKFNKFEFKCPQGTYFDDKISNCNFPANGVPTNCKTQVIQSVTAKPPRTWYDEPFNGNPIFKWVESLKQPPQEGQKRGFFIWSPGIQYNDEDFERGLQTIGSDSYFASSRHFPEKPFSTKDDIFVLQYSAKFEQPTLNCGGGYIKLFDCSLDPLELTGATRHLMSFGPEQCPNPTIKLNLHERVDGSNETVVEILIHRGEHPQPFNDGKTHVYSLIINPDKERSFVILFDGKLVKEGNYREFTPNFDGWDSICGVGFELYQSLGGTVFDNILMTSDVVLAQESRDQILRIANSKE